MKVSAKKWALQYILGVIVVGCALAYIQLLKGQELDYAIQFGVLWAFIANTVYFGRRYYSIRRCKFNQ